jgi:hypothetical protein
MDLWKKKYKEKKKISLDNEHFFAERGEANVSKLFFWHGNPRLEGKAEDLDEDQTEQSNFDAIVDFLFEDDRVRGLLKTIKADGSVNEAIYIHRDSDDSTHRVLEGNCRLAIVSKLSQQDPTNNNWKQIPAILLPGDMPLSKQYRYSMYLHMVGKNDWTPFQAARHFLTLRDTQMKEGMSKQEAIGYVYETIKSAGTTKAAMVKEIETAEFMQKYKIKKTDQYSMIHEGYIAPAAARRKRKEFKQQGKESELDQVVLRTINEKDYDNAVDFRTKMRKVFSGSIDTSEPSKAAFKGFLKGELLLTEAANRLELTTQGAWEKDTIRRFHDFITTKELRKQKRIVTACVKYEEIHKWMREIELCSRMHAGAATNIQKLNTELIDALGKKK